ncbi:MAG: hypothetical protein GY906_35955, partial [bacterium]|nr:hypothetical protein [bacterium]
MNHSLSITSFIAGDVPLFRYHGDMPILVLSARPDLEVNHRLVKAGQIRGVEIVVMDGSRLVSSTGSSFSLWAGDSRVASGELPDAVFARVGNWRPCTMLSALEVMESCGVPTPNPSSSIRIGRDHWQTIRTLNLVSISTPTTLAGADPEALAA